MMSKWLVAGTGPSIESIDFDNHKEKNIIGANAIGKIFSPDYYWLSDPFAIKKFGHLINDSKWVTEKIIIDGDDQTNRHKNFFDYNSFDYYKHTGKEPDHIVEFSKYFRLEEFSEEEFRNANLSGFSCISFMAQRFNPERVYIAGFDGYEINNEHFYEDPDHGFEANKDYWDEEYVKRKNKRSRKFMVSFLEWAEENGIYVEFLTDSKYKP